MKKNGAERNKHDEKETKKQIDKRRRKIEKIDRITIQKKQIKMRQRRQF